MGEAILIKFIFLILSYSNKSKHTLLEIYMIKGSGFVVKPLHNYGDKVYI